MYATNGRTYRPERGVIAQVKTSLDKEKLARIRAEKEKYQFLVKSLLSRINHMNFFARYQAENARLNVATNECGQLKRDVSILLNKLDQSKKVLTQET